MSTIKKTISIDKEVAQYASEISSNFSAVVEEALVEYIHQHRTQKAVQSFGKWAERNESSEKIVDRLRRNDDRQFNASYSTKKSKKDSK